MLKYRLYALCFFVLFLSACNGTTPTDNPLPTLMELPTENVLPPDADATRIANAQTPAGFSDLHSAAVNDTVTFVGAFSYDSATSIASVQTDDGLSVQLIVPPPMVQSFDGQRVQVSGQITDSTNLTVNVQNIAAIVEATLPAEVTSDAPPVSLPPELGTQNAPTSFNISSNLTALDSYDAIVDVQGDALAGDQLVSISNEIGVWRLTLLQPSDNTLSELVIMPDGSVQSQSSSVSMPESVGTMATIERAQVTIDSDDFVLLLREHQLDHPPYTIILSAVEQGATWSAVDTQGQLLLTVNAITGDVVP